MAELITLGLFSATGLEGGPVALLSHKATLSLTLLIMILLYPLIAIVLDITSNQSSEEQLLTKVV